MLHNIKEKGVENKDMNNKDSNTTRSHKASDYIRPIENNK